MTAQELLSPRFKVIADFPGRTSDYGLDIDEIIEFQNGEHRNSIGLRATPEFFRMYPHLFRELQWWEYRTLDEMPKYLTHPATGEDILEIEYWEFWYDPEGAPIPKGRCNREIEGETDKWCSPGLWKPDFNYKPVDKKNK